MADGRYRNRRQKKKGSIIKEVLLWFLWLVFCAAVGAGVWFYFKYGKEILDLKTKADLIAVRSERSDFMSAKTSLIYYSDGTLMQTLNGEKNVYYLPYSAIPKDAINAVLAVEDRKFYSHKGYDVYAIGRAAKAYIENEGAIRQGGSTITQQLARNMYLTNEKTVERKITEIFLAADLEKKYSKSDILEFYLNNIYFANGYYGLQAAAKGYFGVTVGDLSLSQIAFLCGIPNSPSAYDPRAHFDKTLERRGSVLEQMREVGFIGEDEYNRALSEKITLVTGDKAHNNYEETYTFKCAITALMQLDGFSVRYSFEDADDEKLYNDLYYDEYSRVWHNLYSKGYRIYTSINPAKQKLLQEAIDEELGEYTEMNDEGVYALQSSGVCIDNDTGFVVAIIGGRSSDIAGYTLNRAYQSPRQPGSSIKPLIVYTPAFERGYYPDTEVLDEKFEGGPKNSEGVYSGLIDVRYAVSASKNTVAWKILQEIGVSHGLSYLKRMNFASIVDTDYYPAAALGGLTYGATAVEMTSAYAALANDGVYRTPTCILRITDSTGAVIIDNSTDYSLGIPDSVGIRTTSSTRIYEKNAARMMTDVMTTVMESGTGRRMKLEGMTSAGKTGTTNDQKDGWFMGFTRYYTTGIWVGYDMPRKMEALMGNTYPGRIWHRFMQDIHEGFEDKAFEPYVDNRPKPTPTPVPDNVLLGPDGEPLIGPDGEFITQEDVPVGQETYPYGYVDYDGDGIPDGYPLGWTDNDGDGIPDGFPVGWVDFDGDGVPDGYPKDYVPVSHNELTPTPIEGSAPGTQDGTDTGVIWVRPGEEPEPVSGGGVEWVTP